MYEINKHCDYIYAISVSIYELEKRTNETIVEMHDRMTKIENSIEKQKGEFCSILENGKWKESFERDLEELYLNLKQKYEEINKELDKKMSDLPKAKALEERIHSILDLLRNEQDDILSSLEEEAKTITWEKNNA